MIEIKHVVGDATNPEGNDLNTKVIVHVCNDGGGWGHGFVMALSKKWPQPEAAYRLWSKDSQTFKLGNVQMIPVETFPKIIVVANMIGQVVGYEGGVPPIRYEAIRQGLRTIRNYCIEHNASVHAPRLGCNLAGGSWAIVSKIIEEELCVYDIPVTIYDFSSGPGYVGDYNP